MKDELLKSVEDVLTAFNQKRQDQFKFEKNKLYNILGDGLIDLLTKYNCYIAGGTITSLFTNSEVNDFDIYFRDEESCVKFIEDVWEEGDGYVQIVTNKSVLLKMDSGDVQLIHFKYFEKAEDIFDTFDFTVCMGAFDFKTKEFVLHDEFLKHNSQRIIKFNKNTAFPIVSLLRVQKYNKKKYTISKPEFLRIVMKCMSMDIKTVEELKEQLGGMYGINYDKLIKLKDGEEFSLEAIIDSIEDLSLDEDYFNKPEGTSFDDIDDIIDVIAKNKQQAIIVHDRYYKIGYKGALRHTASNEAYEIIDGEKYINNCKFYKFVKKLDEDTYVSHWDNSFHYKIGEEAIPKGDYLYFNDKAELHKSSFKFNGALLEVKINYKNFVRKDRGDCKILATKCKVIREVPKEEYEKWN